MSVTEANEQVAYLSAIPARKNWSESLKFGFVGLFLGSLLWILIYGFILLLRLGLRLFPDITRDWTLTADLFTLLDHSGFLIPLIVATAMFFWKHRQRGRAGLWLGTFDSLLGNRSAIIGIVVIGLLGFVANFADAISPYHPERDVLLSRPRTEPCIAAFGCEGDEYYLGLDLNGRDLFSRVVWGTRNSLPTGIVAVTIAIGVGTMLGLLAGYYGGWVDNLIMRVMDVLLAFPALLLAIAIVTILGPGLENALIAISIVAIPTYARLTRASVLSLKEQEFIVAEVAMGATSNRIMQRHLLPNAMTPLIVQGTLGVGTAVLDAAALSFLGLGAQPPAPEWGQMLSESISYVFTSPHMVFFPGLAIMITVLGFNLLGDGMRDALDPRLNKS